MPNCIEPLLKRYDNKRIIIEIHIIKRIANLTWRLQYLFRALAAAGQNVSQFDMFIIHMVYRFDK